MTRARISRTLCGLTLVTMLPALSGCESGLVPLTDFASKTPAICEELLGEPADAVTAAVIADNGAAVVPWDRFLSGFEDGCDGVS